ncbi:MAG: LysR family transcriptional regulator [Gammaproteobacteria bacterium]|nr:LysR family transcriptional regulator [Gammaproteobacteria bacterium]MBU1467155.1 LysR family transcriptional regulator [Gammaproteobacteria bacterium]MBU2024027.1 LysR family transcriptional regulator [Gammaproteobacteria bacterium]MBU2240612.1 LysR family transcriptional regulator [Gammaproteobacteria bacterium]MBU2319100.1 LysR family transcriptional regulator [Gammaproteobacteria bacterium]
MKQLIDFRYFQTIAKTGSIRKAADKLSITSTALNRRIISLEEEVGEKLFERHSSGVTLTSAGELFLSHIQKQLADFERVKSQISDLQGVRRGHVNLACSQALLTSFFPQQIATFRKKHPAVTFSVFQRDRLSAEASLLDNSVDLAMIFEPIYMPEMKILMSKEQQLYAIMQKDHPLANKAELRLSECSDYPLALPRKGIGVREIIDFKASRSGLDVKPCVESDSFEFLRNHAMNEGSVTFQIEIGIPQILDQLNLTTRPLSKSDISVGCMYLIQKKDRILPVATALFSEQLINALSE